MQMKQQVDGLSVIKLSETNINSNQEKVNFKLQYCIQQNFIWALSSYVNVHAGCFLI